MPTWIIISQIICLAAAVGLVTIVYDLDYETPWYIRYGLLLLSVVFVAVFGASFKNREVYEHAAAIAFTGLGVMVVVITIYLVAAKQIQVAVIRVLGTALSIILLVWLVGSCSDKKRQELQMGTPIDSLTSSPTYEELNDAKKWQDLQQP